MTNSRQNTVIIVGVIGLGAGAEIGMIAVKGIPETTTGVLGNLLTAVVAGLIGFLARGPGQPQPESKPDSETQEGK